MVRGGDRDVGVIGALTDFRRRDRDRPVASTVHKRGVVGAVKVDHNARTRFDLTVQINAGLGFACADHSVAAARLVQIERIHDRIDQHRVACRGRVARGIRCLDRNGGVDRALGHLTRRKGDGPVAIRIHRAVHRCRAKRHDHGRADFRGAGDQNAAIRQTLCSADDVIAFDGVQRQVVDARVHAHAVRGAAAVARRVGRGCGDVGGIDALSNFARGVIGGPLTVAICHNRMGDTCQRDLHNGARIGGARDGHTVACLGRVHHVVALNGQRADGQRTGFGID